MIMRLRLVFLGVPGVPWHPQILADQFTLTQPRGAGGQICPPNNTGTPGFSDLPTALTVNTNQLHCLSCQIKVPAVTLIKLQSVV